MAKCSLAVERSIYDQVDQGFGEIFHVTNSSMPKLFGVWHIVQNPLSNPIVQVKEIIWYQWPKRAKLNGLRKTSKENGNNQGMTQFNTVERPFKL